LSVSFRSRSECDCAAKGSAASVRKSRWRIIDVVAGLAFEAVDSALVGEGLD
jgi:hypothetical protein